MNSQPAIFRAGDVDLHYQVRGEGPDVILLHPYPSDHRYWLPVAPWLESRFRLILPDLRGLGGSAVAEGEAITMARLAEDLARLLDHRGIGRAAFVGCSIGGYVLFEFWRRWRERVGALVLMDTKASADAEPARLGRLRNAEDVLHRGPEWAIEQMLPRLLSPATWEHRPQIVEQARRTMSEARAPGMAALQRGMALRPDSTATLSTITAPTLVMGGEDDAPSPAAEMESMARAIRGAECRLLPRAGHFAAIESPEESAGILRAFLERHAR